MENLYLSWRGRGVGGGHIGLSADGGQETGNEAGVCPNVRCVIP